MLSFGPLPLNDPVALQTAVWPSSTLALITTTLTPSLTLTLTLDSMSHTSGKCPLSRGRDNFKSCGPSGPFAAPFLLADLIVAFVGFMSGSP